MPSRPQYARFYKPVFQGIVMVPSFGLYRKYPKAELSIYAYLNCELGVFVDVEKSKSPTQPNRSMN